MITGEQLVHLRPDWKRDPSGSRLRACLEAQLASDRAQARLDVCLWLLAGLGALLWLSAVWPAFPPYPWHAPLVLAWAAVAAAALGFFVDERYWRRRLADRLDVVEPAEGPRRT